MSFLLRKVVFFLLFVFIHNHPFCVCNFHSFAMVDGLKSGSRVENLTTKVLGQPKTKILFPKSFETEILHGEVVSKGQGGKMVVMWDDIGATSSVSSRLLQHEVSAETVPPVDVTTETVLQVKVW